MSAPTTPAAYMYRAALFDPHCAVVRYTLDHPRGSAYVHVDFGDPEGTFDRLADNIEDLDRDDEQTFDSGVFPKRVPADQLQAAGSDYGYGDGEDHGDYCDRCHRPLLNGSGR